jgi:hypothetical protein
MDRKHEVTEAEARRVKAGKRKKLPGASAKVSLDMQTDASSASKTMTGTEGDRHSTAGATLKRRSDQSEEEKVKSSKNRSTGRRGEMRNRVQGNHPVIVIKSFNAHK